MDDLELVKRAMSASRGAPINKLLVNTDIKENLEKEKIKNLREEKFNLFEKGYKLLISEINKNSSEAYSSIQTIEPVALDKFLISQTSMNFLKNQLTSENATHEDPLYLYCGYTSDILLLFYDIGMKLYQEGQHENAICTFIFLTQLWPNMQSFWTGLGLCYEKNLEFDKAVQAFEQAAKADPSNFSPFYGLIRCSENIHDFSVVVNLLQKQRQNEALKAQIEEALAYIESKKLAMRKF